eukprot:11131672-Lingulodinium_polyedra.AAC.1
MSGKQERNDASWLQRLVSLLPKIPGAARLRDFRPIWGAASTVQVVLKVPSSSRLNRYQFAFRPGGAARDV